MSHCSGSGKTDIFGQYIKAVSARFEGLLPRATVRAIIDTFCNATQELDHRGPVTLTPYAQQSALTLNNSFNDQHALQVNDGHVTIGPPNPTGTVTPSQVVINNSLTTNSYVTHNNPVNLNDDVRFGGDLIPKSAAAGMGMAIARIKLTQSISPGQIVPAQVIDGNGNPTSFNASGTGGSGSIMVRLPACLTAGGGSVGQCNTYSPGTCGFAAYFSDNAAGGAAADVASRVNTAAFWEIISLFFNPSGGGGQINAVTKICCSTVGGQSVLVVCTTNYSVCANVIAGSADCGGGSCS